MSSVSRRATKGGQPIDYTKLRDSIKNTNAVVASTLRNAVPTNGRSPERNELNPRPVINTSKLNKLSDLIANNVNASSDLREITPYIDKAENIWSTLLLFPNGQQERILSRDTENTRFKNSTLHKELLTIWGNYYTNDYKIESMLRPMINDVLWNTGSYTILNLSRPMLDNLINGSSLDGQTGNEEKRDQIANEYFVKVGDQLRVRNMGQFVRNPNGGAKSVTGVEDLFGDSAGVAGEPEFNIFSEEEDPDKVFDITITDNPAILYMRHARKAKHRRRAAKVAGMENFSVMVNTVLSNDLTKDKPKSTKAKDPKSKTQHMNLAQLEKMQNEIFPTRDTRPEEIKFVRTSDAYSIAPFGRGISEHCPSTAVIPIHYNGNNGSQTDYLLLLDEAGDWLNPTVDGAYYQSITKQNMANETKNKLGSTNQLIASLKTVQQGRDCDFDMSEFAEMAKSAIIKRFMASIVSDKADSISVTLDEEVNRIFLSRMFKGQQVRCLYVPGECVSYVHIRKSRLGVGQSLTQLAKLHIARMAALDLADVLANLEGAQPHTLLTIRPEEEDDDPQETIAMARQNYFEGNPRLHSILSTANLSVPQIVDTLREQSLTVKIDAGENKHIIGPDMEFSQMEKQNFKPVDESSRREVGNKIAGYFCLPMGWLDVSDDQNNFQIEALVENQMIFNQAVSWGDTFAEGVSDIERKHAMVNQPFMAELVRVINDNKKMWAPDSGAELPGANDNEKISLILQDFIDSVYCKLPQPVCIESTNKLKDNLDAVNDLVEKWMTMSGYDKTREDVAKILGLDKENYDGEQIKESIRGVFTTIAFRRFNIPMPFDDIVDGGAGGGMASLVTEIASHRTNVGEFLVQYITSAAETDKELLGKQRKKVQKALDIITKAEEKAGAGVEDEETDMDNPAVEDEEPPVDEFEEEVEEELDEDGNPIVKEEEVEEETTPDDKKDDEKNPFTLE